MISATSFDVQLRAASSDDLRILVVGAGIAGLTIAQLLRAQGRHPVLIERSRDAARLTSESGAGYMLALMPLVDPVFSALGNREAYEQASTAIDSFDFHSHRGALISSGDIGSLLSEFGDYRGISRGRLIDVLALGGCPVSFGTEVSGLIERTSRDSRGGAAPPSGAVPDRRVHVDLVGEAGAGHSAEFDLVIIADGLHSTTRDLVLGRGEAESLDTTWGGWVTWTAADGSPHTGSEVWGDGFFLGSYPVRDRLGVFLGGPDTRQPLGPRRFAAEVRRRLRTATPRLDAALAAFDTADELFYWPLRDVRCGRWTTGSTVLLGDAAAGFLPTAGVGAAMAMESAWVLSRVLDGAGFATLETDLARFEALARPRVERAQDNSRNLARMMFRDSALLAAVRSEVFRFVSVRTALAPIVGLLDDRVTDAMIAATLARPPLASP
ncbi:NAD(P)/FAD-dependent oxidoreductase [Brevibacterium sp. 2SA]|uniref:FAD-dependent oxidoreductase n=1 Tax=Brevibacterium sp. 2SA TaxID=2502198 RepID=UPI0014855A24|nr:NAD(P)/FAD-dependent oxidoreductase [Brevibacterium sp. 2SA]